MNPADDISKTSSGDYERHGSQYRCGRGAEWRKPCVAGPTPDGKCGGISECAPVLHNGKFECRRPPEAGGPCAEGPDSGGQCAHRHPPCVPRLTLRARRGRLTWQICGIALLLLAAGSHFGLKGKARPPAIDPGPLSAKHARFAESQGCATCHAVHNAGSGRWLRAVFTHSDVEGRCAGCHTFGGPAVNAHNEASFASTHGGPVRTACRSCHTEHRGETANITTISDAQCHTCHTVKFASFTRGHPPFRNGLQRPGHDAIQFNHAKHLDDYFVRANFKTRAPQGCAGCHFAARAESAVRTAGFDQACGACHAEQIPQNELTLLRLPEPTAPADLEKLGADDATTFMAWIVQRGTNTVYGPALGKWFGELARDGIGALARTLNVDSAAPLQTNLLTGLNPELLQRPLSLWNQQKKFEPTAGASGGGWYWMEDLYPELRYKPTAHADPIARAWVEFALNARLDARGDRDRARRFEREVANPATGVGRCLKCHTTSYDANVAVATESTPVRVEWHYVGTRRGAVGAHTKFSHGPHVELLACSACHALDAKADYDGQFKSGPSYKAVTSGFHGITVAQCTSCHGENKVRADCSLCHQYHRSPALNQMAAGTRQGDAVLSAPERGRSPVRSASAVFRASGNAEPSSHSKPLRAGTARGPAR